MSLLRSRFGRVDPRRLILRIIAVSGLTIASVMWSEQWFWARWRSDDTVPGVLITALFYGCVVQVCLLAADRLQVQATGRFAWRRIFLLGALYGWLVEGVLATTVLELPPLSFSYTGLAWHALFTVLLGWWWVPATLAGPRPKAAALLTALGAGLGTWSAFFRFDEGVRDSLASQALYFTVTTAVYAAGLAIWWSLRERSGRPTVRGSVAAILVLVVYAAVNAIAFPLTLAGPLLVLIAWLALRHTAPAAARPSEPASMASAGPAPVRNVWLLIVVPPAATASYAIFAALPEPLPTGWIFYLVTVPLGFVLFAGALRPAGRGRWPRPSRRRSRLAP